MFTNRKLSDLAAGDRVATLSSGLGGSSVRIYRVVSRDEKLLALQDGEGNAATVEFGSWGSSQSRGLRGSVVWTDPLPVAAEEPIAALVAGLAGDRHPVLLHVGPALPDGRHEASYVGMAELPSGAGSIRCEDPPEGWAAESVGNAVFWSWPVVLEGDFPEGALIAARSVRCRIEGGVCLTAPVGPATVGIFDRDGVGAFLPARPENAWGGPSAPWAIEEEEERAVARTEPDEALVLVSRDGDMTYVSVLGSSGVAFFRVDGIEDMIDAQGEAPGLYLFADAKWWTHTSYEGEHDAGIDGDLVPATEEDLARFGFDGASVVAEIMDVVECTREEAELLARSATSVAAEMGPA